MSIARFRVLASAALVDGNVAPAERAVLEKAAQEMGVAPDQIDDVLAQVAKGEGKGALPKDPAERKQMFSALVKLFAADGVITKEEERFFCRVAPRFGIDEMEAETILRASVD